jgi:choline kinase
MLEVVILAGGRGSRLEMIHNDTPKTLLKISDRTILDIIIETLSRATDGAFRLIIAAGAYFEDLEFYVRNSQWSKKQVKVIHADRWTEGNAATLLAVKGEVKNSTFIVQMSDHLFSQETYQRCIGSSQVPAPFVCGQPVSDGLPPYLDLDDATKVEVDERFRVRSIGKEIPEYNMIDMGIFRMTQDVFEIIENLPKNKKSLSLYVSKWREENDFYVSPQPGAKWKDIDSPEDYEWAKRIYNVGTWSD